MCKYCNSLFEDVLYQTNTYCNLKTGMFAGKPVLKVDNIHSGCPPFAECSAKNMDVSAVFAIKYCPECGRKLIEKEYRNETQEVSNNSPELDKENGELISRKAAIEAG